jgi:hypothetical protein
MKRINSLLVIFIFLIAPVIASAQNDTSAAKKDTVAMKMDTASKMATDTAVKKVADTIAMAAIPMNCYKQWMDYFTELGAKPVTDGTQLIVIAFKSKESCHCYMGKVEVAGGRIKLPVYVQTEGGDYKTFTELGRKLDADFIAVQGDGLWQVSNGMSVVFQTTDNEYGRIFFYKFLNKNKQMSKEAPSPADLLK